MFDLESFHVPHDSLLKSSDVDHVAKARNYDHYLAPCQTSWQAAEQ